MTRYVIADDLLFDDEAYEVSKSGCAGNVVMVGAAASRCFATLLEAQGEIVTKKELLYAGWERYGQQVSSNSVNQSIAQIRRCLVSVGNPDVVVTVPRIGYKVCDGLSIVKIGVAALSHEQKEISVESPDHILPVEPVVDTSQVERCENSNVSPRLHIGKVALLFVNACLALGGYLMQQSSPLSTAIDFSYQPVPTTQSMRLFVAPNIQASPERISAHLRELKKHPPGFIPSNYYNYVYFNGALRDEAYSYFLCHEPIEISRSGCFSYFIVDEYKP